MKRKLLLLSAAACVCYVASPQVKQGVNGCLQALPISSKYVGPPKSSGSYKNLSQKTYPHADALTYKPKDTEISKVLPVINYESSDVAVFEDARIYSHEGVIITKDDVAVEESCLDSAHPRPINKRTVFRKSFLGLPKQVNASVGVALTQGSECYYHWMLEVVPKLMMLKKHDSEIDYYAVSTLKYPFHKQTIEALGIPEEKILVMPKRGHHACKKVLYPHLALGTNTYDAYKGDPLAPGHLIKPYYQTNPIKDLFPIDRSKEQSKKILISRQKAKMRRVTNEDALWEKLEKEGFTKVCLEDLPLQEQAQLFHEAKVVVSPHGAGLTNLVFSQPNTKLIELFGTKIVSEDRPALSHYALYCDHHNLSYDSVYGKNAGNGDLEIPIEEVCRKI